MSSKLPIIFGFVGLISIIAGTSYYFMNKDKNSDNKNSTEDYGSNKGPQNNKVVFSNTKVNPEPLGLMENYFGGKRSKKKKYFKKNKSKKNGKK
jgi:hypothetical protein